MSLTLTKFFLYGAGCGVLMTWLVAIFFGFGRSANDRFGIGAMFRFMGGLVLFAGAVAILVAAAMLQNADVWQMVGGYLTVRVVALVAELIAHQ